MSESSNSSIYWREICGPGGMSIWDPNYKDLSVCFQQITFKLPALVLIAILSAYYNGKHGQIRKENQRIIWPLILRITMTIFSALIPIIHICVITSLTTGFLRVIDYLEAAIESIAWLIHFSYLHTLQYNIAIPFRGPTKLCVVWSWHLVSTMLMLRSLIIQIQKNLNPDITYFIQLSRDFNICTFVFQIFYLLSLFINDKRTPSHYELRNTIDEPSEYDSLLGNQYGIYNRFHEELDPNNLGIAMENTNLLSKIVFYWVNPLIEKGSKLMIHSFDDLYEMPSSLNTQYLSTKLNLNFHTSIDSSNSEIQINTNHSLLKALHKSFGLQFYSIGILKLLADSLGLMTPIFLNLLITFLQNGEEPYINGYLYAGGLTLCTLLAAFCITHFNFLLSKVNLKIRASLITIIYKKILTLQSTTINLFSVGEIINFMNSDTERIINSCSSFHTFWSIPFQLFVSLYLLYKQIGISFLAGVLFTIILIPINKYIASKIGVLSTKLMQHKDSRVELITEALRGIKTIKFNLWENFFINKIEITRQNELKYLKGRKYLDALCVYFWATTPIIISIFTFVTYVLIGNELSAATVFTCIALMNMLIAPLNSFPWVLNGLTEAWVSLKRIQRLLNAPSFLASDYYTKISNDSLSLHIKEASFFWNQNDSNLSNNVLSNICLNISKGSFVGIIGPVGSGKTSLLNAIIGELNKSNGIIELENFDNGFGFVSQNPWIQRGTIRENILMGKLFEPNRFRETLHVCALSNEVSSMPGGTHAQIGNSGSTLSGGQKSRLALARAVYHDKPIYILDDVLSALDETVAKWVLEQCFIKYLGGKTRILCTHQPQHLLKADHIIILNNGQIVSQGTPQEVLLNLKENQIQESKNTNNLSLEESTEPFKQLLFEETSEIGSIHKRVLLHYWRAIGTWLAVVVLLSLLLMQASRNITDLWLTYWVSNTSNYTNIVFLEYSIPHNTSFYLTIYGILVGLNSIFTFLRAFIFAYGGIKAAKTMHKLLLKSVMMTNISFFDSMPLGSILNRFSSDTYTADDSLPFILNILLAQFFTLLGVLFVIIFGQPWLIIILIPLIPVYHWLQDNYRITARELRRIVSRTLTPLYSQLEESLSGLIYIRSFRVKFSFIQRLEELLDASQRAQFSSAALTQWLGLRLLIISVILVWGISFIACLQHQYNYANPGLIGLALSYALTLTSTLSGVINAFTETEREMIAVERINQFYELLPEENNDSIKNKRHNSSIPPPYGWPALGVINFINVTLKYQSDLEPALKRISFETRPAEKIGVIGRTGSGKSSLLSALLRITPELDQGVILVDNIDISELSLQTLRSHIAIIPQEPFLFAGTIRENLKPEKLRRESHINDAELWNVLRQTHLENFVKAHGGLDSLVLTGGRNFSAGQKQLFCLARALLQKAKIICLDEATANIDIETDKDIQKIIKSHFRCSTIITIAHRIESLHDYDRILIMENGRIKNFAEPRCLSFESISKNLLK